MVFIFKKGHNYKQKACPSLAPPLARPLRVADQKLLLRPMSLLIPISEKLAFTRSETPWELRANEFCVWALSDPVTKKDAANALRDAIPKFERYRQSGQIELLKGTEWYLQGDQFDLKRITGGWNEKLEPALAKGFDEMISPTDPAARWTAAHRGQPFFAIRIIICSILSTPSLLMWGHPLRSFKLK